jgi:hypothetical protein
VIEMKTLRTITAIVIAVVLVLGPALAFAAVSVTVQTNASTYSGQSAIQITGTVTPAPSASNTAVVITTTGPAGAVDTGEAAVATGTGAYSYPLVSGGSPMWVSGTYTVNATYGGPGGASSEVSTFSYSASTTTSGGSVSPTIDIFVSATSQVFPDSTVQIEAMTVWSNNGTLATASTLSATLVAPGATSTSGSSLGTPSASSRGEYIWTYTVPQNAAAGAYFVQVLAKDGGSVGWGLGQFTVSTVSVNDPSGPALQSIQNSLSSLTTAVSGIQTTLSTISSSIQSLTSSVNALSGIQTSLASSASTLSAIQTSLTSITSGISGIESTLNNIASNISAVNGISGQLTSLNGAINNNQTYVLVVAALAAITLVLELAILVRKLS